VLDRELKQHHVDDFLARGAQKRWQKPQAPDD
jgi:hypothetical protein